MAPLAAATTGGTQYILSTWGWDEVWAFNADGTRRFTLRRPSRTSLQVAGESAPAGTTIRLTFDSRFYDVPTLALDGQVITPVDSTSNGVTTVDYLVNSELVVGEDGWSTFSLEFSNIDDWEREWPAGELVTPTTLAIVPAPGSAPGTTTNSERWDAQFVDTHDLAITDPQYTSYEVRDWRGDLRTVELVTGVTLTNLGPAPLPDDFPSSVSLFFNPELVIGDANPPAGTALVTNIQAVREGAPAIESIDEPEFWNQVRFEVNTRSLEPGEQIVVSWQLNVNPNGGHTGSTSNVSAWAPGVNENNVTSDNHLLSHYVDLTQP